MSKFRTGQYVVWEGIFPCIGVIKRRHDFGKDECYDLGAGYDSCHHEVLRKATEEEKVKYIESGEVILKLRS